MERRDLKTLRGQVSCVAVLESNGWAIDIKESTTTVPRTRGDEPSSNVSRAIGFRTRGF